MSLDQFYRERFIFDQFNQVHNSAREFPADNKIRFISKNFF
jgi:hypothetical protein